MDAVGAGLEGGEGERGVVVLSAESRLVRGRAEGEGAVVGWVMEAWALERAAGLEVREGERNVFCCVCVYVCVCLST